MLGWGIGAGAGVGVGVEGKNDPMTLVPAEHCIYELPHVKIIKMTFAPSADSDQHGHLPSLTSLRSPHVETWVLHHTAKTDQTGRIPILIGLFPGHPVILLFLLFCHALARMVKTSDISRLPSNLSAQ